MAESKYLLTMAYDSTALKQFEKDCEEARIQAQKLGINLTNMAVIGQNVRTSINKLNEQVRTVTTSFDVNGKTAQVAFSQVGTSVQTANVAMQTATIASNNFGTSLQRIASRALLTIPAWLIMRSAFMAGVQLFQESIKFMVDWETEMARVRAVTGETKERISQLSDSLLKVSEVFGVNDTEVAKSTNTWLRLGATYDSVLPSMIATAKYALISGQSLEESSKILSAVKTAFALNINDLNSSIDKLIAIEQKSGVSLDVMTEGLAKAGPMAKHFGLTLDELAEYLIVIKSKAQLSGEQIGTQLNTMFTRLSDKSIQASAGLSKVAFYLDASGKATMTPTTNLRAMSEVLGDVATAYQKLGTADRAQLLIALGNPRQITGIAALLDGYKKVSDIQKQTADSSKIANEEIKEHLDTTGIKLKQVHDAWDTFVNSIPVKGEIGIFLDNIRQRIDAINLVLEKGHDLWQKTFGPKGDWTGGRGVMPPSTKTPTSGIGNDSLSQAQIQGHIKEITDEGISSRKEELGIVREELGYLNQQDIRGNKILENLRDNLKTTERKLVIQKENQTILDNSTVIEAQMKEEGASALQIAIHHLAVLRSINETKAIGQAQAKVSVEEAKEEKSLYDHIIASVIEEAKAQGETSIQQIELQMHLQDQLDIHLQGVDLLKQQLALYKAITSETSKTPLQREKEALALIKKTPTPQMVAAMEKQEKAAEPGIMKQARARGIESQVENILHPNTSGLMSEIRNGLTNPLSHNINSLGESIKQLAKAIIDKDKGSGQTHLGSTTTGTHAAPISVVIQGIHITSPLGSKEGETSWMLHKIDQLVAAHLVDPSSKSYKAAIQVFEKY